MTDKTPEIQLNQLTAALEFLSDSWDKMASEFTRRPESRSREDNIAAVNLYGAFTQSSTALRFLVDNVRGLPADASPEDIRNAALTASQDAGEVWD